MGQCSFCWTTTERYPTIHPIGCSFKTGDDKIRSLGVSAANTPADDCQNCALQTSLCW